MTTLTPLGLPLYETSRSPYSGILLAWDLKTGTLAQVRLWINLAVQVSIECVFRIQELNGRLTFSR